MYSGITLAPKKITPKHIVDLTAEFFKGDLTVKSIIKNRHSKHDIESLKDKSPIELLKCNRRFRAIVEIRQIMFYYAYKETSVLGTRLANEIGKDHSTGIHGVSKFQDLLEAEELMNETILRDSYQSYKSFMNKRLKYK